MSVAIIQLPTEQTLGMIRKAESEIQAGKQSGNFGLVTSAKLRRAVATMSKATIETELLEGMGINAEVSQLEDGVMIEIRTTQSLNTILRALRLTYDVVGAMGTNGRMAVRVSIPALHSLHNVLCPPTGDPLSSNSNKDVVAR